MLLDLLPNASSISRNNIVFSTPTLLTISENKFLIEISDEPQPQIKKVDSQLELTPNFLFSLELSTVYEANPFKNVGVIESFERIINLFEVSNSLLIHFEDKIVIFQSSQKQNVLEMKVPSVCAYKDGFLLAESNVITTYSLDFTALETQEVSLNENEVIEQILYQDDIILILTTDSRVLVGQFMKNSFIEVYQGEHIEFIEMCSDKAMILAIGEDKELQIIKVSASGNGFISLFKQQFEGLVKAFVFAPELEQQQFIEGICCAGVIVADKVQAVCFENEELFLKSNTFRDVEKEYLMLKQLLSKLQQEAPAAQEFIKPPEISADIAFANELIVLDISSSDYITYCDIVLPPALFISKGQFDAISPSTARVYNKSKIELELSFLAGYQYYVQQYVEITAVCDSYVNAQRQLEIPAFCMFKPVGQLPKVPVFVQALVKKELENCRLSMPADFLEITSKKGESLLKGCSLYTIAGIVAAQKLENFVQYKIDKSGFYVRLQAFARVFAGKANDFEYWKLKRDIELYEQIEGRQVDMNLVSKGLSLIQSGLWKSCEFGVAKIRRALGD